MKRKTMKRKTSFPFAFLSTFRNFVPEMKKWTVEDARELYNIGGWGTSYFGVNEEGNVFVTPCKDETQIDLHEVMSELALRDVESPVLQESRRRVWLQG